MPSIGALDAALLATRYSFSPNRRGYCGECGAFNEFLELHGRPTRANAEKAIDKLREFKSLVAYLETIAGCNGLEPFDYEVVEAYWLGNNLLNNVKRDDVERMIVDKLGAPGMLPKAYAAAKARSLPPSPLIHHSFHVLYVGFVNPEVPRLVENLDSCIVGWGRVKQFDETVKTIVVEGTKVVGGEKNNKITLETGGAARKLENVFSLSPAAGDVISFHWGVACQVLDGRQARELERLTLASLNSSRQ